MWGTAGKGGITLRFLGGQVGEWRSCSELKIDFLASYVFAHGASPTLDDILLLLLPSNLLQGQLGDCPPPKDSSSIINWSVRVFDT